MGKITASQFVCRAFTLLAIPALLAVVLAGCADNDEQNIPADLSLPVTGDHIDEFRSMHEISRTTWINGSVFGSSDYRVLKFDGESEFLVARNGNGNAFNPGKYSRFDWTTSNGALHYCQVAFAEDTAAAAEAVNPPDNRDPINGGCGAFPWTRLFSESIEVKGVYLDNFGGSHAVTQTLWDQSNATFTFIFHIIEADNTLDYLLAENDAANSFNPSLFSRFNWTTFNGSLFYCQSVFNAASPDDARAAPFPDPANPPVTGCGGFSWTNLTP